MPGTSPHPKKSRFTFRIDPALKAAFSRATEAEDRPAAQVLRDFMRTYVKQRVRRAILSEARRQSLEAAVRAADPQSDDAVSLQEFETLLDEDHFDDEWKA